MEKKRIEYIDIIKAICIFLVVVSHSRMTCPAEQQWINSFFMPTFFAVTGFAYSIESHAKRGFLTVDFVVKKLKRLMLPAAIWGFGYMIALSALAGSFTPKSILYVLYGSFWSLKAANSYTPLWFLASMFLAVCLVEMIFQALYKLCKNERQMNIAVASAALILSIIASLLPWFKVGYPWCADIAVMAAAFILIGYLFKQVINSVERLKNENTLTWLVIFFITFILVALTFKLNVKLAGINHIKMAEAIYGVYPIFMFDAIAGMVMVTAASVLLSKTKYHGVLTYVGKASFTIFLVHRPIVINLCNALVAMGIRHWVLSIPLAAVTVAISCLISMVIDKYIPEIVGGTRSKK